MDPHVLVRFYRPVSLATHLLDGKLWPNNAFMWHAHSFMWFAVLLIIATRLYRNLQGPLVGTLAAALFALDHTHTLAVSFSTNRYVLIATALCMLSLDAHQRQRQRAGGSWLHGVLAVLCYALALLAGESSAAFVGYLFGYALFVDRSRLRSRVLSLVPYFLVTVGWRAMYNALGRGARGSDLYIDPARESLRFLAAMLERGPSLLLGQWGMPPAETYTYSEPPVSHALIAFAWLFLLTFALAVWPLLKRDRIARFWAMGMVLALVPMCSGEPNNRMLFTAGIGASGLLAQWWAGYVPTLTAAARPTLGKFSRVFGEFMLWSHLVASPLLIPANAISLALFGSINRAFDDVGPEAAGSEAVFVTTPDYFATRLMRMTKEVEGKPTPSRWRALTFGPEQVTVKRTSDRSIELDIAGGAMHEPAVTKQALDLYRSSASPMVKGQQVDLEGMHVEVLEVTSDGRPQRVRFDFSESLDSDRYRVYQWADNHFRKLQLPAVSGEKVLPKAIVEAEFPW
jgi:hypothetical protein